MNYPKQTDNYDVDIFNQNFREIANKNSLNEANLQDEIARAKGAERANANAISAETSRAMVAEQSNSDAIAAETNRALVQEALKAPIESPAFTGAPQAPTPETSANDLRIATTAFVKAVVNALIDGAPETLDTLKEIADAIVDHREITDALNAAIGNKVDKISGKGLSSNDYTTEEKQKLFNIESGAQVNVQSDFDVTDSNSDAYIKNKPTIPTKTSELVNDSGFLTSESVVSGVSGVKGNAESKYRTGNVNLTPANIGAVETSKVLATADQINANTDTTNVAGATAVKEMVSQINGKLEDLNPRLNDFCTIITDWDMAMTNGWYMANDAANAPGGGWWYGIVIAHDYPYVKQVAFNLWDNNTKCERIEVAGKWSPWVSTGANALYALSEGINNVIKKNNVAEGDFNNYLDEGRYSVSVGNMANAPAEYPTIGWGMLCVFSSGNYVTQMLVCHPKSWCRIYAGYWRAWYQI